jgi:hypothetical protein
VNASNHRNAAFEASMRLMWTGGAMIVLGAAFFALVLLALPYYFLLVAGAVIGVGLRLVMGEMRRQRNMHPY